MMSKHRSDEAFDTWLREELHSRQTYLEDEGFSDRVLAAVPARPATDRLRPYLWSLLLALAATLLTLWLFPGWSWLLSVLAAFITLPLMTLLMIGAVMSLVMAALVGLLLWQSESLP